MLQRHLSTWDTHVKQAVTKITKNPPCTPTTRRRYTKHAATQARTETNGTARHIATRKTDDRQTEHKHQQGTRDQGKKKRKGKRKDCSPEVGGLQIKQTRTTEKGKQGHTLIKQRERKAPVNKPTKGDPKTKGEQRKNKGGGEPYIDRHSRSL